MTAWSTDHARKTYSIPHWSEGYYDVDDAGRGAAGLQPRDQGGVDAGDVGLPLAGLQEVEASVGGGASHAQQRQGQNGHEILLLCAMAWNSKISFI